jgi:hypothetical protein
MAIQEVFARSIKKGTAGEKLSQGERRRRGEKHLFS